MWTGCKRQLPSAQKTWPMLERRQNRETDTKSSGAEPFFKPAPAEQVPEAKEAARAMNLDLEGVSIRTDGKGLPADKSAMARGREVVLSPQVPKDSDTFNYLVGHELAHVAQQREGASPSSVQSAEQEAAGGGLAFALGKKSGRGIGYAIRQGISKTAAHFSSCFGVEEAPTQIPDYMGAESREAIAEIERIIGSTNALSVIIVAGTVGLAAADDPLESAAKGGPGDEVNAAAQALRAVPTIRDARITQIIQFLLLSHENDMNRQERQFWHRALDNLDLIRTR